VIAPRPAAGFVGRGASPDATAAEAEPKPARAEKAPKPAKAPKVKAESSTEPKKSPLADIFRRITSWGGWDGLAPQMWTAGIARWQTFEEVRKDEYATGRAWLIVGASVFFAALGGGVNGGPASFFVYGISAAIGAAAYLGALYVIATGGFGGRLERNGGTLFLQRLGLSASPGVLLLLSVIPTFGPIFVLVSFIWIGFASVKPIELSLELDSQSAGYSVIFAWFALFGFGGVLPLLIG
jgi:hypothetical protein